MYNMVISILGYKLNLEILILIGIIYLILVAHTVCGCCNYSLLETFEVATGKDLKKMAKEGFASAVAQTSPYDLNSDNSVDTSKWSLPNLTVVPGKPLSSGVKEFLERKQQPLPLPDGEMDFFANSEFKPECCPNTYSNSQGCWCGTAQDFNYLVTRAGNNVPYSEY